MIKQPVRVHGLAERSGEVLDGIAESLFLIAFLLFCFKLFWSLVQEFTLYALDIILAWPMLWRVLVGLPLIAAPVGLAAYFLFGNEERPGWLVVAELRKHPVVVGWRALYRRIAAVIASYAFLKLVWLTGEDGADAIDWWRLIGKLFGQF